MTDSAREHQEHEQQDHAQPEHEQQEQSAGEATPHDRRRRRRILIAVGVVLALFGALVAAAVVGESIARQQGTLLIATEVREVFSLEEDHPVEVEFVGFSVLAQLAGGELDGVTVDVPDLPVGELRGDLEREQLVDAG